jgi:hypothetical protein
MSGRLDSDLVCGRHPTIITEWTVDDQLEATLGACWRCRRKGFQYMRSCAIRGVKIEWTRQADIPARVRMRVIRPYKEVRDEMAGFVVVSW